ncbi:MAG: helix-turn-helix transcriptional regulator [Gemmatimonadetes bacterium]|nr:helix-turn-helix transcriptional regulator [Gemmatimonadota bacterium]
MSPESLPVRLRQARGATSLAEATERTGIPAERIRMYEEGERRPYGKTLRLLADAYGTTVAALVGPGDVARPAPGFAARRRRRRRIVGQSAVHSVEVPVEVAEGQVVRVVIELIIRPRAPLHVAEPTAEAAGTGVIPGLGAGAPALTRPAPEPLPAGLPSAGNGGRELREPRDQLSEVRRAYKEFRRDRR